MLGVALVNPGVVAGALANGLAGTALVGALGSPGLTSGRDAVTGDLAKTSQKPTSVIAEASGTGVHAEIHSIGQSSWAKDGTWQEAIFTLTNTAANDDLELIDVRANNDGVLMPQTSPSFTPGTVGVENFFILSYSEGVEYGHREATNEFQKRQVRQVALAAGGATTGSAFFPAGKHFSEIVFTINRNGRLEKLPRAATETPRPCGQDGCPEAPGEMCFSPAVLGPQTLLETFW